MLECVNECELKELETYEMTLAVGNDKLWPNFKINPNILQRLLSNT